MRTSRWAACRTCDAAGRARDRQRAVVQGLGERQGWLRWRRRCWEAWVWAVTRAGRGSRGRGAVGAPLP